MTDRRRSRRWTARTAFVVVTCLAYGRERAVLNRLDLAALAVVRRSQR